MGLAEESPAVEPAAVASIAITVAFSPAAGAVELMDVMLPAGSNVRDALLASGLMQRHQDADLLAQAMGIWGASCALDDVLRDRDRVEVYRPLTVDPKEARRLRYTRDSSKDGGKAR
ncbi:RnfH family protein [soil metagenome]